jgi:hypothetical protein
LFFDSTAELTFPGVDGTPLFDRVVGNARAAEAADSTWPL